MFERYTEKARRVIFFARYEASGLGSVCIESQHLLLGLMREAHAMFEPPRFPEGSREELQRRIQERALGLPPTATSVDLPLAPESRRILAYAAEEAEALSPPHIGTEHILLGIVREQDSFAAKLLAEYGLTVESLREELKAERAGPVQARQDDESARMRRFGMNAGSLLPLSAEGLRVMAHAIEESEALGQAKIGVDHLLLGILHRGDSFSARLLQAKGVEAEVIREELRRVGRDAGAQ
jgi:ATP-dependent Clp protease ATP-binding subunit ClpA